MDERAEKKLKTRLLNFIKENFEFEGKPDMVQVKLYDTNEKLFNLVKSIMGNK